MCGIVGIVGKTDVAQRLFDGLKRLEYRGYDSAGICTIENGKLERRRAEGKLDNLARELEANPLHGTTGIAHTRWATHGAPTVGNAHPHIVGSVIADVSGVAVALDGAPLMRLLKITASSLSEANEAAAMRLSAVAARSKAAVRPDYYEDPTYMTPGP